MNSKYSADLVRQRLKYDSLAGRHLELQSEYESLLKDYKNQQRVARVNRNGPKVKTVLLHLVYFVRRARFRFWFEFCPPDSRAGT